LELLVAGVVDHIVPVDEEHARAATGAWRRFGKGRHPAALNFGDCFTYATASLANLPLLFKGNDFNQTDLRVV
jgi:ribonuclease VapC